MHSKKIQINHLLLIIILFTNLWILFSCTVHKANYLEKPIAIVYKKNIPYIINASMQRFSLEEYDYIVPYFDDILIVKKDNLFGYIKNTGEVLIEPTYNEAYPFSEGKAIVKKDGITKIIDSNNSTLYELPIGYTSISSFSSDLLVISDGSKQGYLKYDSESQSFYFLYHIKNAETSEITYLPYEYCGKFKNGYAVVGYTDSFDKFKYTHIDQNGKRLYDLEWDYAGDFSEGYAVVGDYGAYNVYYWINNVSDPSTTESTTIQTMCYKYISPEGKYLGTSRLNTNGETEITPYVYSQAYDFKDSVAIVSKMYCYRDQQWSSAPVSSDDFYHNYRIINQKGEEIFDYFLRRTNNVRPGAGFYYLDLFQMDNYYVLSYYKSYVQIFYNPVNELDPYTFKEADLKLNLDEEWIDDYLNEYTAGHQTPNYVKDHTRYPYNQTAFKQSKYLGDIYVAKTQVFSGYYDSCGLITLQFEANVENDTQTLIKQYVIPPIYDDIIF